MTRRPNGNSTVPTASLDHDVRPMRRGRADGPRGATPVRGPLVAALVLLFVGLLSAAATQAQSNAFDEVDVALSASTFFVSLTGERIEGDDAAALRDHIDRRYGNADNLVVDEEIAAYAEATRDELNGQLEVFAPALTDGLLVEGRQPTAVVVTHIQLDGARGGVTDNETIVRAYDVQIVFSDTVKERVNVTFAQDFRRALPRMSFETAVFHAEDPWRIDAATIHPGGAENPFWRADEARFEVDYSDVPDFANEDEPLSFHLTREPVGGTEDDGGKDSPSVGLVVMLGVALAFSAFARRR